jgi:putative ABC transport system permease protein
MIPISYNVRSLLARRSTTLASALGIALVVFVFASVLMLSHGIEETLRSSGSDKNAIVLRKGSQAEMLSSIEDQTVSILRASPEAQPEGSGTLSTAETVVLISAYKKDNPTAAANVVVRGVLPTSIQLRENVRIIDGRPFTPGTNEVIVGRGLVGRMQNLGMNQEYSLKANRPVKVVGVFEAGRSSFESEIWGDLDTVRSIFGRTGSVSSVTLRLREPSSFETMKARVESDPRLGLEVKREVTYYEEQSQGLSLFIRALGIMIAVFFSVGAMIGAMITMYAQVAQRGKEIGTLRALGFRRRTVLGSFLIESILLSLGGGALGVAGALCMGFVSFSTVSFSTFSEVVFGFRPTPQILMSALAFASTMGLLGGLFPAVRAAKVNPVQAMRG